MPLPAASPGWQPAEVSQTDQCWPHQGFPRLPPLLVWAGAALSTGPPSPCWHPLIQSLLRSLPPGTALVLGWMTSQSETEESTLYEGHPRAQEDFGEQPVVPVSRQGISMLAPFCCAPRRPLASPLSWSRQECKDTCTLSLSPTPWACSLGPAGPSPAPTLRGMPSLQPAGAPTSPARPAPSPSQPLALHPGLSSAPSAPHPRLFPALPATHSSPRSVPGTPQPLAPYPGLPPGSPQPGLSPPPRVPLPRHISVVVSGSESTALCASRAAALPGPAGSALWCGRKRRGRERKRRGAGERRRHRVERGRERCGFLRGAAGAGPLLRRRPVWIRVFCRGGWGSCRGRLRDPAHGPLCPGKEEGHASC